MLIIDQNIKHVNLKYYFHEPLIFFWFLFLSLALDVFCLGFISYYIKEILYVNPKDISWHF